MTRTFIAIILLFALVAKTNAQPTKTIKKVGQFAGAGIVENIQPGEITIRRADGKRKSFLIQDKNERFLSLDGNDSIVPMPSRIDVFGKLPIDLLEKGMVVKFDGEINRAGRTGKPVSEVQVIHGDPSTISLRPLRIPQGKEMVPCHFTGIIQRIANRSLYLVVPKTNLTPNERVSVKVAEDAFFDIRLDDLNRVRQGDKVIAFHGDTLDNGTMVIRDIRVELSPKREATTISYSDKLYLKHSKLSDNALSPREITSEHFVLNTDVSPRSAQVLLDKLETMYGYLARYFGTKPHSPIECFVVADPENYSGKIPNFAIAKIQGNSGLTQYRTLSRNSNGRDRNRQTNAVVYSCDDHDVVQHEAVHAFCSMAFDQVGPVWYAEGIAELGQYFIPGEKSIQIEPVIVEYLKNAKPKDIAAIVETNQITGDSWKAYAWRWALCRLLSNHPKYSKRFRELGINLMNNRNDSFKKAFGRQMDQIKFEYLQFVSNLENGYRDDLCLWQWTTDPKTIDREERFSFEVRARSGWQATSLKLESGRSYDFVCPTEKNTAGKRVPQTWSINQSTTETSANGNASGDGMLIGAILISPLDKEFGYQLSEPFEIGNRLNGFNVEQSGWLYVRCREGWSSIADNSGEVNLFIRKSPEPSSR